MESKIRILSAELQEHYQSHGVSGLESYIKKQPQHMDMSQEDEPSISNSVSTSTSTRFIRLNPRYDTNQTLNLLRKEFKNGEEAIEVPWLSKDLGFYAIPDSFALSRSETFNIGRIYGMDVSSGAAVAVLLLEEHDVNRSRLRGEVFSGEEEKDLSTRTCINGEDEMRVLDLCCAPGLKTCAIADVLETTHMGKAYIVGVDVSEKRLHLCKNIIKKYHIDHETCGGAGMPSTNSASTVEASQDGNTKIERSNAADCLPDQKIIIQLFNADGTTFGTSKDSSSLIFDSRVAIEQQTRAGKRKRMNKSAKARESKRLKTVADDFFTNVNDGGVSNLADGSIAIEGEEAEKSPSITIPLFDRVLVDAECSTDGAVRHLQHKYRSSQDQLATNSKLTNAQQLQDLVALQKKLIMSGFGLLKPGGIMVYSTCSLAKEQNEDVVSWLLSEFQESAELVPVSFEGSAVKRACRDPSLFPPKRNLEAITDGKIRGTVRFHPSVNNDLFGGGFFLAKITKKR